MDLWEHACDLAGIDPAELDDAIEAEEAEHVTLTHILIDVHEILRRQAKLEAKLGELEREFAPLARKYSGAIAAAARLPGVGMGRRRAT